MRCLLTVLVLLLVMARGSAVEAAAATSPAPGTAAFFTDRVEPILEHSCLRCHGNARQKGRLKLNSREAILAGGSRGPAMIVGDPEHSLIVTSVRYTDEDLQMPPDERLEPAQIDDLVA